MAEHRPFTMRAETRIALSAPQETMRYLAEHFVEHCRVTVDGDRATLDAEFSIAELECRDGCLLVEARGFDESTLAFVKMAVAEHVLEIAHADNPVIVWTGDGVVSGGLLPFFRELRVVGVRDLTPRMRRVTLRGEDIARFSEGGHHVRLLFPPAGIAQPKWPVSGADGRPVWPEGEAKLTARVYTIRRIDPATGEIDIDFVMHGGDSYPGASFGAKARAGDIVGMAGPGGGAYALADWYLFAGDETGLPAIGRMLEELPASAHAVVRIEVAGAAEEQALTSAASLDLVWLHRGAAEAGTTALLEDAVRAVIFPGDGRRVFAWAGCEHKTFRALRKFLRAEQGLSRDQHLIAAYWRRGLDADTIEARAAEPATAD